VPDDSGQGAGDGFLDGGKRAGEWENGRCGDWVWGGLILVWAVYIGKVCVREVRVWGALALPAVVLGAAVGDREFVTLDGHFGADGWNISRQGAKPAKPEGEFLGELSALA
jgi:hypothetical protein